jgi:hypothetical protein
LIAQGQNILQQIQIDAGTLLANFSLTWPGSDLDLELIDPNGNIIGHGTIDPNVVFTSGSTYENYAIFNPVPGLWTMRITGVDVSGLEEFFAQVTVQSTLTMDVAFNKSMYGVNEPILVTATIKDGVLPVTGATVTADVTTPGSALKSASVEVLSEAEKAADHDRRDKEGSAMGSNKLKSADLLKAATMSVSMTLYDDGLHGDGAANDGVYGNYFTDTSVTGSYSFDVSASGTAPLSGALTRLSSKSTVVTAASTLIVTVPQTGVKWLSGSINTVKWSSTNITGNVNIYLSTDGGTTYPYSLALNTLDDGSEDIVVPAINSTTCRIKVSSVNFSSVYGLSPGNFTIESTAVPTLLTYTGSTSGAYSDEIVLSAVLLNNTTGQPVEGETIHFKIGTQTASGITGSDGIATAKLILNQAPAVTTVETTFDGTSEYLPSGYSDPFVITAEVAQVEYTGVVIQATPGTTASKATIELRAVLKSDPDGANYSGDIRNACVNFKINGTVINSTPLVPALLNPADLTTGVVTYTWTADIGSANYQTFTLELIANCYFSGNDQSVITVYKPVGDFVTGGGYLIPENSSGTFASTPGLKTNFGFHVKFNKTGKSLQGGMNIIFRRIESDGLHIYQVKTNSMTSLGVNVTDPTNKLAVFTTKVTFKDLTIGTSTGNLILYVSFTDKGEPGIHNDRIGITLWNGSILLYSSNWNLTNTSELPLDGGNLVVQSGFNLNPALTNKSATIHSPEAGKFNLQVYPNPFADQLLFEFVAQTNSQATIDLYDVTGRKIVTIFDKRVEGGMIYNAVYMPDNRVSNMLIYKMIIGNEVYTGKVLQKK